MAFQITGEKDEVRKDEKHSHIDSERINFSNLFERQLAIANTFLNIYMLWSIRSPSRHLFQIFL